MPINNPSSGASSNIVDADALALPPYPYIYLNSATGNDNNTGFDSGAPLQSFNKAWTLANSLRWGLGIANVYILIDPGVDYVCSAITDSYLGITQSLGNQIYVYGNSGVGDDVIIDFGDTLTFEAAAVLTFDSVTVKTASIVCSFGALSFAGDAAVKFTGAFSPAINAADGYIGIGAGTNFHFDNPAARAVFCEAREPDGQIWFEGAVTINDNPTFNDGFATAKLSGFINSSAIFSGTVTGKRYNLESFSKCYTNNAGANYFPGTIAGTSDAVSTYY